MYEKESRVGTATGIFFGGLALNNEEKARLAAGVAGGWRVVLVGGFFDGQ